MEKEKNNAVEKVENLTEKKDSKKPETEGEKVKNNKKSENAKNYKARKKSENEVTKEVENAKDGNEKRITSSKKTDEKAKKDALKAKKREERERARRAKKRILAKKREEYKAEKLRRKEERLARRDMLRHESREEREKRITAERQAKLREKAESRQARIKLREEKASLRRQKLADKRALKEQKRNLRQQEKREKRSRGLGGWLAAVIALGSSTLILATLFTMSIFNVFDVAPMTNGFTVAESYYSLVDYVDNMNVTMSKILVSNDNGQKQKLLINLSTQASLASEDLSRIPLKDESKYYTTKYINQVADYAKYLNNRLIDGDSFTDSDVKALNSLYEINGVLKEELATLTSDMGAEFDFKTIFNENADNLFLKKFTELEERAVTYPKLIYDGPFSDALDKKSELSGKEVSTKEAEEKFESVFSKRSVKNVETKGDMAGKIDCYGIRGETDYGEVYASISKNGGHLIMFNDYMDCKEEKYSLDECIVTAQDFLSEIGLDDMTAVWATESGAVAYINYCYNQGGVIVYNDMVKVTVCKERGIVSAFDSTAYYLNHKTRKIAEPEISKNQAITGLSTDLSVLATRICLIPKGNTKEVLAYEVFSKHGDDSYYVYIDATTGKEVEILRVVSTLEGNLLM